MSDEIHLEAADGLAIHLSPASPGRISWSEPDWLGPIDARIDVDGSLWRSSSSPRTIALGTGTDDLGDFRSAELDTSDAPLPVAFRVRAYAELPILIFDITARAACSGHATGTFEHPSVSWPQLRPSLRAEDGAPTQLNGYGHQFTEFALPTFSGRNLDDFFLAPFPDPPRPAVVEPLWLVAGDGRCLMLAPLDSFHEQIIAVPRADDPAEFGVRCGWQGDLDQIDVGFRSSLVVWAGHGPRQVLETWGALLRRRNQTQPRSRYADTATGKLSYWTDNGAAYWYRTEPGLDVSATLEKTVTSLGEQAIPFEAFELDSWFYPHEATRDVNPDGQHIVPPTGMMRWEPREDLLPDGIPGLRRRLGDAPLILHSRHFSSQSPYFDVYDAWRDRDRAHPVDAGLVTRLLHQAADWGAIQYEQDWMIESFLGVRGLREVPGRTKDWQQNLDRAASDVGVSLLWCMASPPDFFQTTELRCVSAIRTSGDYRYILGNAFLWYWFLHTNALARALDLPAFKDVFLSRRDGEGWDGDPLAEAEALLAALSAGPVGIGDRLDRSDREIILRTCRADGVLIKPDTALAATNRCFHGSSLNGRSLLTAETYSDHPAARWHYAVSLHASSEETPISGDVSFDELGANPAKSYLVYDWRSGRFSSPDGETAFECELAARDWDFRVVCPRLPGNITVAGDPAVYATAGDRRIRGIEAREGGVRFEVIGAPGEHVGVVGWSQKRPVASGWTAAEGAFAIPTDWDAESGRWKLSVVVRDHHPIRVTVCPEN